MPYADPEVDKAYHKAWYEANRERLKAVRHAWYLKNKEEIAAKAFLNRDHRKERQHARKEETNAQRRDRYASDPEYREKIILRTRSREWNVPEDEYEAFLMMYGEDCFYCGEPGGAVDHLIPKSRGGEDRLYNLVPTCQPCNSSKGAKTPGEWYDGSPIRRSEAAG